MSLVYTTSKTERDLAGVVELQKKNLQGSLSPEEIASQGFVTVVHTLDALRKMNDLEQHIICKDGDQVVAYMLAMTVDCKDDFPVLQPMFALLDSVSFEGRKISNYRYIVVGQVCIAKAYRGQGVFDRCYEEYKRRMKGRYDLAVTEIATRNIRSISAHRRVGFREIHRYTADNGEEWSLVIWPL